MKLNLIPCTHDVLNNISIQKGQLAETLMVQFDSIDADLIETYSRALEYDGEIIGAIGVFPMWEGVSSGWVLLAEGAMQDHWLSISRICRRELDRVIREQRLRRVETVVSTGFPQAQNWAEFLGFEIEGVLRNYGHQGVGDFYQYARVN